MSPHKGGNVLILADRSNAHGALSNVLSDNGRKSINEKGAKGLSRAREPDLDFVITDMEMLDKDGMEILDDLRNKHPGAIIILVASDGTAESAVNAVACGGYYYFVTPADNGKSAGPKTEIKDRRRAAGNGGAVYETPYMVPEKNGCPIITRSPNMLRLLETVEEIKDSESSVLITGETGTGKELIAGLLHEHSHRKTKPFIAVNCAAIPRDLMESELFGCDKGAFTGAVSQRKGKLEEAAGGTILLDEIAEMELTHQAKLLRALEEREIERLGSNKRIKVNFRLLSCTNRDLEGLVREGRFREDLFYRINVLSLEIPPLRKRMSDIPLLVAEFIREFSKRENKPVLISDGALKIFSAYHWPGNVRQLKNVVERAVVFAKDGIITTRQIPAELRSGGNEHRTTDRSNTLKELESQAIERVLIACKGNKSEAARVLGISRKRLYHRLKLAGAGP